jgi:Ca2+-binding EF-hand superfamily protein
MSIPKHINNHIIKLYEASKHELGNNTNTRINKFKNILHIYYPWAKKHEVNDMILLINNNETQYQNSHWKDNITKTHKYDIITLFGILDSDFNKNIDITEFISVFISITSYNEYTLKNLFKQADADKNGSLDILEFIDLISKYPILRDNLENAITSQKIIKKKRIHKRLSILFKDIPDSPTRLKWRPSLSNLHSPNTISRWLRQYN